MLDSDFQSQFSSAWYSVHLKNIMISFEHDDFWPTMWQVFIKQSKKLHNRTDFTVYIQYGESCPNGLLGAGQNTI